jgi:hypothetical protein
MPKGGDLHSHLSGAAYAEANIAAGAAAKLCWDAADAFIEEGVEKHIKTQTTKRPPVPFSLSRRSCQEGVPMPFADAVSKLRLEPERVRTPLDTWSSDPAKQADTAPTEDEAVKAGLND